MLLREGAAQVVAADVGRGLLDWRLQTDERVLVHDRINVRNLTSDDIDGPVELVVADLSFISLKLVLPALLSCTTEDADLVPMVKPQFEVGKDRLGSGGVVRDPQLRADAVLEVIAEAAKLGLAVRGVVASPLPGPAGNVEYFLWLRRGAAIDAGACGGTGWRSGSERAQLMAGEQQSVALLVRAQGPCVDPGESDREVLLVVDTAGRPIWPRRRSRRAGSPRPACGFGCWRGRRVSSIRAAYHDRADRAGRGRRDASWCSRSVATAPCCGRPNWPIRFVCRCSG